jgi:hypothetical protein
MWLLRFFSPYLLRYLTQYLFLVQLCRRMLLALTDTKFVQGTTGVKFLISNLGQILTEHVKITKFCTVLAKLTWRGDCICMK